MPKLSQVSANVSFAFASSKQKRVPASPRSVHQLICFPFAMREASPRSRSNCLPAACTIKQCSLGIGSPKVEFAEYEGRSWGQRRPARIGQNFRVKNLSEVSASPGLPNLPGTTSSGHNKCESRDLFSDERSRASRGLETRRSETARRTKLNPARRFISFCSGFNPSV